MLTICSQTGLKGVLVGFALAIAFLVLLLTYYIWENRRRDRLYGPVTDTVDNTYLQAPLDATDRQNTSFRYTF